MERLSSHAWFTLLSFAALMGLLAASCRAEEKPDSPKNALRLFLDSLDEGDADKAIKCCRFDEGEEGTAEQDIVRAAVESMEAFRKLDTACRKKWPHLNRNTNASADEKPHVTGPKGPSLGEVNLATEVLEGDVAELSFEPTGMRVKLVKAGGVWLVEPVQYLRTYSCDPADPANGYREYTKLATQLEDDVAADRIDSSKAEQTELKDRLISCKIRIKQMRKRAGQ
jgi:hypothetical protein